MGELANCRRCGRVFVKTVRDICEACYKEEEQLFEKVYKYIRKKENRSATIPEVSEATEVDENLIMKWVKEKRIHTKDLPNFTYECERCGSPIQEGKVCQTCAADLKKELEREEMIQKISEENRKKQQTYFSVDDKIRRKR
ncbi:flagellar operon protein (TIGR03826 family) [Melghiribacillus thermohalophilus]|uniref:Flagellar operon protein (TIGR03826 family) n=1 Tax=Melghiribacillus thermohalophilus TaxID=1324956 RepID=A0A4R3MW53_9BACI|nr:TIGR03826 family flagellar region protein [Melghiribacillus thermohalophilus]TCT20455.1 flagellar operon protein (TIGR03826 family) [Melghiribacillus thermohalophilus]